jgi:hypothetical protein
LKKVQFSQQQQPGAETGAVFTKTATQQKKQVQFSQQEQPAEKGIGPITASISACREV